MAWFGKIGALVGRYSIRIATTGMLAIVGGCFYSQTLGLQHYQHLLAHYKDGVMLPVDDETKNLTDKVPNGFYFVLELLEKNLQFTK